MAKPFIIDKIIRPNKASLLNNEWLLTNGLGGFASSSLCCAPTRKYHALLVAALPVPYGRTVMLNYVEDLLILPDNREVPLSLIRRVDHDIIDQFPLAEFRMENGLPIWRFEYEDIILEKSLLLIHNQNTLHMRYDLKSGEQPVQLKWRPYIHWRTNDQQIDPNMNEAYDVHAHESQYEITSQNFPPLRLYNNRQHTFTMDLKTLEKVFYEIEAARGYESVESLMSPGYFLMNLQPQEKLSFISSTESWETINAITPKESMEAEKQRRKRILKAAGVPAQYTNVNKLVLAADQFIMIPNSRHQDMVRLQAAGEEARSIIAGYPWFTDWGRDTMISLEGLTLLTGRTQIAHSILVTFAHYIKDGLIPNVFPEGMQKGLYHTSDATLWFFHAVDRYIEFTQDTDILDILLPKFIDIIESHIRGTLFGIKVDHDGLLMQGQEGFQLTWMDAKVGDWVVTPRRGKAVEINALWYNALKLIETWTDKKWDLAQKCYDSFNHRFWFDQGKYLYDVIDGENGNDSSLRPNQLFAISLKHPILESSRWKQVLDIVYQELLTPVGLRTLSRGDPNFKSTYDGDLRSRDASYHQGTVWPWLVGPFIDVWLKVYPNDYERANHFLKGLEDNLNQNCIGTIGEIFDASEPYYSRGCFAQAWSVAEVLRSMMKTNPDLRK